MDAQLLQQQQQQQQLHLQQQQQIGEQQQQQQQQHLEIRLQVLQQQQQFHIDEQLQLRPQPRRIEVRLGAEQVLYYNGKFNVRDSPIGTPPGYQFKGYSCVGIEINAVFVLTSAVGKHGTRLNRPSGGKGKVGKGKDGLIGKVSGGAGVIIWGNPEIGGKAGKVTGGYGKDGKINSADPEI